MIFHFPTEAPNATVVLFGGRHHDPAPSALEYSLSRGYRIHYTVLPPSNQHGKGYQVVASPTEHGNVYSDGILLAPGTTATIRSKDCAIVFIKNTVTGYGVLLHAGRPAMTPNEGGRNIIDIALSMVQRERDDPLRVYIRGSICQRCFVHKTPEGRTLIEPFADRYSGAINHTDGGLDIPAIIVTQLRQSGVKPQQIDFDSLCTYEHAGLSSHRRRDPISNLVLVINH